MSTSNCLRDIIKVTRTGIGTVPAEAPWLNPREGQALLQQVHEALFTSCREVLMQRSERVVDRGADDGDQSRPGFRKKQHRNQSSNLPVAPTPACGIYEATTRITETADPVVAQTFTGRRLVDQQCPVQIPGRKRPFAHMLDISWSEADHVMTRRQARRR